MKNLLRIEELSMFGLSIFLFTFTDLAWWSYLVFILAPDLGMLGYLAGNRTGAICYNLCHHKGVAIIVLMAGFWLQNDRLLFSGCILFGHSSLDRIFGYGLKYNDAFKHTHLGWIGGAESTKSN